MDRGYELEPRPAGLGGGWRLRLFEDGEEAGGGVFPMTAYMEQAENAEEAYWLAYEDALDNALAWSESSYTLDMANFNPGDRIEILPEFRDGGDEDFEWVVVSAEDKGRVDISPVGTGLAIPPRYTVDAAWIRLKDDPGQRA